MRSAAKAAKAGRPLASSPSVPLALDGREYSVRVGDMGVLALAGRCREEAGAAGDRAKEDPYGAFSGFDEAARATLDRALGDGAAADLLGPGPGCDVVAALDAVAAVVGAMWSPDAQALLYAALRADATADE